MSTPNVMFGMRRAGKTTALVKAFLADPRGVLVMPSSGDAARVIIDHNLHHVGGRVVTWDGVVRGRRMPYGMKLYVDDFQASGASCFRCPACPVAAMIFAEWEVLAALHDRLLQPFLARSGH